MTRFVALAGLLLGLFSPLSGQTPCGYDRCAIRLHTGIFSSRLVQGSEGTTVVKLGLFPGRVDVFERGSDSVRAHYHSFQSAQRTGAVFAVLSAIATTAGGLMLISQEKTTSGAVALLAGGFVLGVGSGIGLRLGSNHLSQTVWWYNRELAR